MAGGRGDDDYFDLIVGRAEGAISPGIVRTLGRLLPAEIVNHPTVVWFRAVEERSLPKGRSRSYIDQDEDGQSENYTSAFVIQALLQPVIQSRLDFLARSLYTIGRIMRVSERTSEIIRASSAAGGAASILVEAGAEEDSGAAELRQAVSESLPDLLTALDETHSRRRELAMSAFQEWLTATEEFRSVFEPANDALREMKNSARYRRPSYDRRPGRNSEFRLSRLVGYLSRYPRLGGSIGHAHPIEQEDKALVLSPLEVAAILSLLTKSDDYDFSHGSFTRALREISLESLAETELAILERRLADSNPFTAAVSGAPSQVLQAAMRDHVLSNGSQSPWLREFLNQVGRPLGSGDRRLLFGHAYDAAYVGELAQSAHSTIIHSLLTNDRDLGETWGDFLGRLFTEKWLKPFVQLASSKSASQQWTLDNFTQISTVLILQLRRDGYRISYNDQILSAIWTSQRGE